MKKMWTMLFGALALLSPGIANTQQMRLEMAPDNIALSSEGPLLLLEGLEPRLLPNLHYEGGSCYTICDVPQTCLCCCKSFETSPTICDCCGCDHFVNDPYEAYPWLGDILVAASPVVMWQPTGGGDFHADNQGGQVRVEGGVKTDDGTLRAVAKITIEKGPDGKVNGSGAIGVDKTF